LKIGHYSGALTYLPDNHDSRTHYYTAIRGFVNFRLFFGARCTNEVKQLLLWLSYGLDVAADSSPPPRGDGWGASQVAQLCPYGTTDPSPIPPPAETAYTPGSVTQ